MSGNKDDAKSSWVDPDDAAEPTGEWFARAGLYDGGTLIRRGGRPKKAHPKEAVSIRLDREVVSRFRAGGRGWQSRINEALRKAVGL